jgi:anthranilate synthase component 1
VPRAAADGIGCPDLCLMYADVVVAFDNVHGTMQVIVPTRPGSAPAAVYEDALALITSVLSRLDAGVREGSAMGLVDVPERKTVTLTPHISKSEYCEEVIRIKEHIAVGDVFQVVPSQRFSTPYEGDGLDIYRVMREVNPSPYMLYVRTREVTVVGASPESLVRITGKNALTRPLAGTRARGATPEEDAAIAKELLGDEKERAEHVMLVDLARNDLGRVCAPGSVDVDELLSIERYSHVMHLSSNVTGTLASDASAFDALRATFPAGTVSGAPKVRAMQLIAEFEDEQRGPYAGAVGYFGLNGSMDMCIDIRCVTIAKGQAIVQVGAGVVADSKPESEYQETLKKAAAMREALELVAGMAEGGVR